MKHIPSSEANSRSASQENSQLVTETKYHNGVYKSPPQVLILSQMYLVHKFPPHFPKIHSNTILPSTPRSSQSSLPFKFSD
jgi:hypothetical protein